MLPPAVCLGGGGGGGGGATGLLNKGGGSNRLPMEFPQVQSSYTLMSHLLTGTILLLLCFQCLGLGAVQEVVTSVFIL